VTDGKSGIATLPHVDDTVALGALLGSRLRAGDVVVLSGPLGAGKTVLAKGIAAAMDVDGPVTSPTFVLARVHPARRTGAPAMIHVDVYRLLDHTGADLLDELESLDLDAELDEGPVGGPDPVEYFLDDSIFIALREHLEAMTQQSFRIGVARPGDFIGPKPRQIQLQRLVRAARGVFGDLSNPLQDLFGHLTHGAFYLRETVERPPDSDNE